MTQPDKSIPTLGDMALEDLAGQLAASAKNLAVLRAQYRQLLAFVESKSDVLGLTKVDDDGADAGAEDKTDKSETEKSNTVE